MCVRACKHEHLLGLRAACFTGETVDVCVWLLCACVMVINQVCIMYACKHVHLLVCGGQLKLSVCDCESGDKLKPSGDGGEVS